MINNIIAGKRGIDATYSGGRGEIFHDWFPYLEGFSKNFVANILNDYIPNAKLIIEPFAGIGTTPITLAQMGISSTYCEVNPVLRHLIKAKSESLKCSQRTISELDSLSENLFDLAASALPDSKLRESYISCFKDSVYFNETNFENILRLKSIERNLSKTTASYFNISVISSLLQSSFLKRAGDVRFKTDKEISKGVPDILECVSLKLRIIVKDLTEFIKITKFIEPKLAIANSKDLVGISNLEADGVITSPPYLNGTNYFRNTRLELWYFEAIKNSSDLRQLRDTAVTAGINDVTNNSSLNVLPEVTKYHSKILEVCYDSRIPKMVAAYFNDMKQVFLGIRQNLKSEGIVCVDIGDSIYSNVHIPTHTILSKISQSIGWKPIDEVILRERFSNNGTKLSQRLLVFKNG